MRIEAWFGDITTLEVDAIVNAANRSLLGGGGVDGSIHRAAGPGLLAECRLLGGCDTGDAKLTRGHRLRARWVVHTVGPVWRGGGRRRGWRRSPPATAGPSRWRVGAGARSIAFPAISTGAFGFPEMRAARIAVETVSRADPSAWDRILLVGFDRATHERYRTCCRARERGPPAADGRRASDRAATAANLVILPTAVIGGAHW